MKSSRVAAIACLGLICATGTAWPKGAIIRIVIDGVDLQAPIELTDPGLLEGFTIWSGPGVHGWDMLQTSPKPDDATFIVDWQQGVFEDPPEGMQDYEVRIHIADRQAPQNTYEVIYRIDSKTDNGYVYLPRSREGFGRWNTFLIYREVEGEWFHASRDWEEVIRPLLP